jgi:hypothetical protein
LASTIELLQQLLAPIPDTKTTTACGIEVGTGTFSPMASELSAVLNSACLRIDKIFTELT